jgi:hypothetical protein
MTNDLLPKRFLFRFSVPCRYRTPIWTAAGSGLDESYCLTNIAELEDAPTSVDFRMAWSETGLAFRAGVLGKRQPPWCRTNRPEYSDSVQIWIDTRDVHNIHRAGRFCHRFLFMPTGGGNRLDQPVAQWLPINRAKEHPKAIAQGQVRVRSEKLPDGYVMEAFIATEALTGFDVQEHPRLGFTYAVIDRELGERSFSAGSPMPYQEDPSLWATLELVR